MLIKTVCYWLKSGINGNDEYSEIDPHIYGQKFLAKYPGNKMGKNNIFNKWCWNNQISIYKETATTTKLNSQLRPYGETNARLIMRLKKDLKL